MIHSPQAISNQAKSFNSRFHFQLITTFNRHHHHHYHIHKVSSSFFTFSNNYCPFLCYVPSQKELCQSLIISVQFSISCLPTITQNVINFIAAQCDTVQVPFSIHSYSLPPQLRNNLPVIKLHTNAFYVEINARIFELNFERVQFCVQHKFGVHTSYSIFNSF